MTLIIPGSGIRGVVPLQMPEVSKCCSGSCML
eukprot:CAMPEP_0203791404 /NCGR_PEP_ID=MMETSP0100_2-20121128/4615_1 /ASSEMBLY_ACC=CAM_ASM_000210 /TAXON_ID=96639 /ORGANISM=" , Strain NY0313808BC1" /LENGTH=31 /DNA_ID= /DNA_START= /DNA_END= /DNA_ORIENTATION=